MLTKHYFDFIKEELYSGIINGLRVYIMPKIGYSKSFATLTTKYGSNDIKFKKGNDTMKEYPMGIAHFLEHKLFEEKEGNVFDRFAALGSSPNAYTNFKITNYHFTCTSDFEENLELLIKFVYNPYFTKENVEKEKGIIEQEIKMYEDNPNFRVYYNALEAMYKNHPVKNDIAGTVQSIREITPELLYECYNTFYVPENMVLTIVGDVKVDKIVEIVEKLIPKERNKINFVKEISKESRDIVEKEKNKKMGLSIPNFIIGFKDSAEEINGNTWLRRKVEMDIVNRMLFSRSSNLYENLYEIGLINDSFSYEYSLEEDYCHLILGGESKDPLVVKEEIMKEMNRIKNIDVNDAEFTRIKKMLVGAYISKFNSIESLGNTLSDYYIRNINLFEYYDLLKNVTKEDIKYRINELFKEEYSVLSIIG